MTRYQYLATLPAERIEQGLHRHGKKLPSVHSLSRGHGVSISTVQQAYQTLKMTKPIAPQSRSGYSVVQCKAQPPVPPMTHPVQHPVEITQWDQVLDMLVARSDGSTVLSGKGIPGVEMPSPKPPWRELNRVVRHDLQTVLGYDLLAGQRVLREQAARLMLNSDSVVTVSDIIITSGCYNSMSLVLVAMCKPGDIATAEFPCYYGSIQMLRGMGMKVIEIPTDPETGISIEALEPVLEQWPTRGIILVPSCNNPPGFTVPDTRKWAVFPLTQHHDIVISEDNIYGELVMECLRPWIIHSQDIDGRVLLRSSFSRSITPGLRVSWVAPGHHHDRLLHVKYAINSFNVPSTQMMVTTFVLEGRYHRHIRRIQQTYQCDLAPYIC